MGLTRTILMSGCLIGAITSAGPALATDPGPDPIVQSDVRVLAEKVGTMPRKTGPGLFLIDPSNPALGTFPGINVGSPVAIGEDLFFVDQVDGILRLNDQGGFDTVFSIDDGDAPAGLDLANRQAVMNISEGRSPGSMFIVLTANGQPVIPGVPVYAMPQPSFPGEFAERAFDPNFGPIVPNIYNIVQGDLPGFPFALNGVESQILHEGDLVGGKLVNLRAIAVFESHNGPHHHGGAMLTLPDGQVLYVTGDGIPFGINGRESAQDLGSHLSKMLLVDPDDGSAAIVASGLRNVQHMEYVDGRGKKQAWIGFADIGGWIAEEVNFVEVSELLDLGRVENFGWGINADGFAREGTFYVEDGVVFTAGTPAVDEVNLPSTPEHGFIQPHAQYERPAQGDPNGGLAATGPVTSKAILALADDDLQRSRLRRPLWNDGRSRRHRSGDPQARGRRRNRDGVRVPGGARRVASRRPALLSFPRRNGGRAARTERRVLSADRAEVAPPGRGAAGRARGPARLLGPSSGPPARHAEPLGRHARDPAPGAVVGAQPQS